MVTTTYRNIMEIFPVVMASIVIFILFWISGIFTQSLNNAIGQQTWVESGITKTHWSDNNNRVNNIRPRYGARYNRH